MLLTRNTTALNLQLHCPEKSFITSLTADPLSPRAVLVPPKAGCSWGEGPVPLLDPYGPLLPALLSAFH